MDDQTKLTSAAETVTLDSETRATVAKDGASDTKVEETKVTAEEKKARVYSEEEWNKRQSALDSQVAQAKREQEETRAQLLREQEELRAQIEERRYSSFLHDVEEKGGDLDLAKALVAKEKELSRRDAEFRARDTNLKKLQSDLDGTAKAIAARDLVAKYELPKEAVEELLKSKDPVEMKATALEMALAKTKSATVASVKTAKDGDSTKGVDLSKMSLDQRLNWILEHSNK